jgi:hypothetical protein
MFAVCGWNPKAGSYNRGAFFFINKKIVVHGIIANSDYIKLEKKNLEFLHEGKEIPCLLRNPELHCHVHKSLPEHCILS